MHTYTLVRNDDRTYSLENSPIHIDRLGLMANRHVIDLTALPDDFTSFTLASSIAISKTTKKHVVHAAKAPYLIIEKRNKPAMLCMTQGTASLEKVSESLSVTPSSTSLFEVWNVTSSEPQISYQKLVGELSEEGERKTLLSNVGPMTTLIYSATSPGGDEDGRKLAETMSNVLDGIDMINAARERRLSLPSETAKAIIRRHRGKSIAVTEGRMTETAPFSAYLKDGVVTLVFQYHAADIERTEADSYALRFRASDTEKEKVRYIGREELPLENAGLEPRGYGEPLYIQPRYPGLKVFMAKWLNGIFNARFERLKLTHDEGVKLLNEAIWGIVENKEDANA